MPLPAKTLSLPQRIGVAFGTLLFRLLILTLRVRPSAKLKAYISSRPRGTFILLWHNRLALALAGFQRIGRHTAFTGLVSASGDGAYLSYIMNAFDVQTARGSSSKRAVEATRELLAALQNGRNIVVTPDGPRGPVYTVKDGTAELATHAQRVYVAGLKVSRAWQLKSWDKFLIPQPFATLTIDLEEVHTPNLTAQTLEQKLRTLND